MSSFPSSSSLLAFLSKRRQLGWKSSKLIEIEIAWRRSMFGSTPPLFMSIFCHYLIKPCLSLVKERPFWMTPNDIISKSISQKQAQSYKNYLEHRHTDKTMQDYFRRKIFQKRLKISWSRTVDTSNSFYFEDFITEIHDQEIPKKFLINKSDKDANFTPNIKANVDYVK